MIEGKWPADDLRRAFVAGAKWWEYHKTGFTMWPSDQRVVEAQADSRYPSGCVQEDNPTAQKTCGHCGGIIGEGESGEGHKPETDEYLEGIMKKGD